MNILSLIGRSIKLSIGLSLAASAASDTRKGVRTFRRMVEKGKFEVVDSDPFGEPEDGLRMAGHAVVAGSEGYLAWRLIGSALR